MPTEEAVDAVREFLALARGSGAFGEDGTAPPDLDYDLEECWALIRPPLPPTPPEEAHSSATTTTDETTESEEHLNDIHDLDFDQLTALPLTCPHVLDPALLTVLPEIDDDNTLTMAVSCPTCGSGGRITIEPSMVNWTMITSPSPAESALDLAIELREATVAWLDRSEEPELATILGEAHIVEAGHGPGRTLVVRLLVARRRPCWWGPVCQARVRDVSGGRLIVGDVYWAGDTPLPRRRATS